MIGGWNSLVPTHWSMRAIIAMTIAGWPSLASIDLARVAAGHALRT
jgi:hypothetical protein